MKTRQPIAALGLLAVVGLTGCWPDKADKADKAATLADAAVAPPPPVKKEPDDLRARMAQQVSRAVDGHRKEVDASILRIIKASEVAREETRLGEVKVVQRLTDNAAAALDATNRLVEALLALDRELVHAQGAFQACATMFRERAEDYAESANRDRPLQWARFYDELAATIPPERARIVELQKILPATLALCRESSRLLADYGLFLGTLPDDTDVETEVAAYESALKGHVARFRAFEQAAKAYRGPSKSGMAKADKKPSGPRVATSVQVASGGNVELAPMPRPVPVVAVVELAPRPAVVPDVTPAKLAIGTLSSSSLFPHTAIAPKLGPWSAASAGMMVSLDIPRPVPRTPVSRPPVPVDATDPDDFGVYSVIKALPREYVPPTNDSSSRILPPPRGYVPPTNGSSSRILPPPTAPTSTVQYIGSSPQNPPAPKKPPAPYPGSRYAQR